eukprot:CFRG8633T1
MGGGGMGGGGDISTSISSDLCTIPDGTSCSDDGTTNEVMSNITYDDTTGIYSGIMIFNQCPNNDPNGRTNSTQEYQIMATSSCQQITFPDMNYEGPVAAPLRGRIGLSMYGVNIYGPMEAGFQEGFVCDGGSCEGGVDVPMCAASLDAQCSGDINEGLLLDPCGGHAQPYHYHENLACDYDQDAPGHGPLIGIALDGVGIYGLNEDTNELPTDLDACGGHVGYIASEGAEVYHYHVQSTAPYTLGCFGPVNSVDECKALYPDTCGSGYTKIPLASGEICYDSDCPCFNSDGSNTDYDVDSCPV